MKEITLHDYEEKIVPIAGEGKLLCQTMRVRFQNHYFQPDGLMRISIHRYEGGNWLPTINSRPCPYQPSGEQRRAYATYAEAAQVVVDELHRLASALLKIGPDTLTPQTADDIDARTAKQQ